MAFYYEIPLFIVEGVRHVATPAEKAEYDAKLTAYNLWRATYNPLVVWTEPPPQPPESLPEWDVEPRRTPGRTVKDVIVEAASVVGQMPYVGAKTGLFRSDTEHDYVGWHGPLSLEDAVACATRLVQEKLNEAGMSKVKWGPYGEGVYLVEQMQEIDKKGRK